MSDQKKRDNMSEPSDSASDRIPVESDLEKNAPVDAGKEPHPGEYQGYPRDAMAEEPPHAAGGVGGRPTLRQEDESWTPAEGTSAIGSRPTAAMQSVAAPDAGAAYAGTGGVEPVTQTSKEEYVDRMKANLEERGIDIKDLMARAEGAEATARSQYLQQLDNLRALQDTASQALQSLVETGESTWRGVAGTVDKAYENLRTAVDAALNRLR